MTLTDEEAERVFGALRREWELDMQKIITRKQLIKRIDHILDTDNKLRNLRRQGRSILKIKAVEWYMRPVTRRELRKPVTRRVKIVRTRYGTYTKRKSWSKREIYILRRTYSKTKIRFIARKFGRSERSVYIKANRLKIRKVKR